MISPEAMKEAAARFPSGVTLVGCTHDNESHAMTVSAFSSISIAPPLVMVSIANNSRMRELISRSGLFSVSVLAEAHRALSSECATPGRPPLALHDSAGSAWRQGATGSPIHRDAVSYFDCRLHSVTEAGDHTIFLGAVEDAGHQPGTRPLVYWCRDYRQIVA